MISIEFIENTNIKYIFLFFIILSVITIYIFFLKDDVNLPKRKYLKKSPIENSEYLGTSVVEANPVIYSNKKIIVESWRKPFNEINEVKLAIVPEFSKEGYKKREYVDTPLKNHSLASAIVVEDTLCIFAVNEDTERTSIDRACFKNGVWDSISTVYESNTKIFNVSIAKTDNEYVILKEVSHIGIPFTMVFGKIKNIMDQWNFDNNTVYGTHKYTGGPSIFYAESWYYLLYLEQFTDGYATRIARTKNLIDFEESDQIFLDFNKSIIGMPRHPNIAEQNASDPEMIEVDGKTIVLFTRGNQKYGGNLSIGYSNLPITKLVQSFWDNG